MKRLVSPTIFAWLFVAAALLGGVLDLAGIDTTPAFDLHRELRPPDASHWLGTAEDGVDLGRALLAGAKYSASIALLTVALSYLVGTTLGAWAGLRGRWVDGVITGAADLVQSFPAIVLHVAILAALAEPSRILLVLALSTTAWVLPARIARAEALRLRDREFVVAAEALGLGPMRALVRHVLPNLAAPILVQASAAVGHVILAEATLSFLGVTASDTPSWGALLEQGTHVMLVRPHVLCATSAVLALTLFGFHALGDDVRDRLARAD